MASIKPKQGSGNAKSLKEIAVNATEAFYRAGLIDKKQYINSMKAWN